METDYKRTTSKFTSQVRVCVGVCVCAPVLCVYVCVLCVFMRALVCV
jgi:hypothetical protein